MKKSKNRVNVSQPNHQNSIDMNSSAVRIHKPPPNDIQQTRTENGSSNSWVSLRSEPQVRALFDHSEEVIEM